MGATFTFQPTNRPLERGRPIIRSLHARLAQVGGRKIQWTIWQTTRCAIGCHITEPLSEVTGETRRPHGNSEIATQHSSGHEHHTNTPFKAVSSNSTLSLWQERFFYHKNSHLQLKKGRRRWNRIAISLLTTALPLELRHSNRRPQRSNP